MNKTNEIVQQYNDFEKMFYINNIPESSTWIETFTFSAEASDKFLLKVFEDNFFEGAENLSTLICTKSNNIKCSKLLNIFFKGGLRACGYISKDRSLRFPMNITENIIKILFKDSKELLVSMFYEDYTLKDNYKKLTDAELELDSLGMKIKDNNKIILVIFDWRFD